MPRQKGKLQIKAEYWAVRLLLGLLGFLPLAIAIRIGEVISFIPYKFLKRLRFVGFRNLKLALNELSQTEHEEILRGTFKSLGRQLAVFSQFSNLSPDKARLIVDVEGLEYCREEYNDKPGRLLFTGHFGAWELSNFILSAYGFPMNVVARRIDNTLVEDLVESMRTTFGSRTIDKKASARTLFRCLQKEQFIGILIDLNTQEHEGIFVEFFGIPASTTTGLAKLALRTDTPVLPVFAVWQKEKKRYLLKVCSPVEIPEGGDTNENVKILTQRVTTVIEDFVRRYPDQWLWIHKRWNTRPEGEPNLYAEDFQISNRKSQISSQTNLESHI